MKSSLPRTIVTLAMILICTPSALAGETTETACHAQPPMSNEHLGELIQRIDNNASGRPGFWTLRINDRDVLVLTDEKANRMRIISPIALANALSEQSLFRLLQANFDTALDARYTIAKDRVWSAFLHPLNTLCAADFISGIGQVVNLAATYGTTYSSGGLTFGGGDSNELIQDLMEKGLSI